MAKGEAHDGPGWRPDPVGRHQHRYWDGTGWTADVADDGVSSYEAIPVTDVARRAPAVAGRVPVWLRRTLWELYALPITAMLVYGAIGVPARLAILVPFDSVMTAGALTLLQLHIWDKKVLNAPFLKTFAFSYLVWDLLLNLVVSPYTDGRTMDALSLLGVAMMTPLYFALFRYAFRVWPSPGVRRVS